MEMLDIRFDGQCITGVATVAGVTYCMALMQISWIVLLLSSCCIGELKHWRHCQIFSTQLNSRIKIRLFFELLCSLKVSFLKIYQIFGQLASCLIYARALLEFIILFCFRLEPIRLGAFF